MATKAVTTNQKGTPLNWGGMPGQGGEPAVFPKSEHICLGPVIYWGWGVCGRDCSKTIDEAPFLVP